MLLIDCKTNDTYHVIESLSKSGFQPRVMVEPSADVLGSSNGAPSRGGFIKTGLKTNKK